MNALGDWLLTRSRWEHRFWAKVEKDGETGCWNWTASTSIGGYGRYGLSTGPAASRRRWSGAAHRISYELLVGPIPEGLTLDHLCRNTRCVNPDHLEPATQRVNILRGNTIAAKNAAKTHCPRGHEYTPENTLIGSHGRDCKECSRIRRRNWYRIHHGKAVAKQRLADDRRAA